MKPHPGKTNMKRRSLLTALVMPLACAQGMALAQDADADAPIVRAPRIVEALTSRDIVVDKPSAAKPAAGKPNGGAKPPSAAGAAAIDLQVQFTYDSAELRPQGKRQLDELAMALNNRALRTAAFELAGHTDRAGSHAHNMRLSLERAEAVKAYLMSAHNLPAQRLFAIGFGFTRLADPSRPESAVNRRVEVRRLVGGSIVPTPR
jgi:OmpA-OmpF porin, OOP family